jgi:hypothetical protein
VKLVCSSLMLGYNKLRELAGLNLSTLDYAFEHFPHLKTLYIHCNFLPDLAEL